MLHSRHGIGTGNRFPLSHRLRACPAIVIWRNEAPYPSAHDKRRGTTTRQARPSHNVSPSVARRWCVPAKSRRALQRVPRVHATTTRLAPFPPPSHPTKLTLPFPLSGVPHQLPGMAQLRVAENPAVAAMSPKQQRKMVWRCSALLVAVLASTRGVIGPVRALVPNARLA